MISVIIPTLNSEATLSPTLVALVPGAVEGVIAQVIIADGGSGDHTEDISDAGGAKFITAVRGRGEQLKAGALVANQDWLLFVHADTILDSGVEEEIVAFCRGEGRFKDLAPQRAGVFSFALNDNRLRAKLVMFMVDLRCRLFGLAYGDQGLLISRRFYDEIGGFHDMPLMEDVDIIRRIGRRRLSLFVTRAITSAERYRADGYFLRILRNLICLALYILGVSPHRLSQFYSRPQASSKADR